MRPVTLLSPGKSIAKVASEVFCKPNGSKPRMKLKRSPKKGTRLWLFLITFSAISYYLYQLLPPTHHRRHQSVPQSCEGLNLGYFICLEHDYLILGWTRFLLYTRLKSRLFAPKLINKPSGILYASQ